MEIPVFSNKSLISVPIEMHFSATGLCLSTGTGFFYKKGNAFYLITNWHNLTGINSRTKKPLSSHAGRPDMIRFSLFNKSGDEFTFHKLDAALYSDENMEIPYWLIHPKYKEQVDVVALQINFPTDLSCIPINDMYLGFKEFSPIVADDVFILGFPYNIRQINILPIWKRASIATEPEFDYEDKPMILVDTASRSGMSGSPVILRRNGIWQEPDAGIGTRQCFLGIYSGRLIGDTEFEAQLGIVWKKHLIEEIINAGIKDDVKNFI